VALAEPGYITGLNLPVSGGMHLTRAPRQDELPSGGFVRTRANHGRSS
jgi:hypothetical protein